MGNQTKKPQRPRQVLKQEGSDPSPPSAMFVDPTEDGIALDFAERNREALKYDHHIKKWFHYNGTKWKQEETHLAFDEARKILREHNRQRPSASLPKMRTASAVEKFAQADRRIAVVSSRWDEDPWKLCTPGGTVDLRTGKTSDNHPLDYITKCCSVTPKIMPTILWDRFLYETTEGDERLIRFLKMMAGYCLTGLTIEHALFFIYGLGGNGKGVFVNTISAILDDYHVAANMDVFTQSKYDRHPTELARLHGARMVTASETEEGKSWAESRIKQITGGDPIAARFMRGDFFEFTPQFKLVFLGNHKPILHNVDDAARRRFNIVPFVNKPVRPDKELPEKLKDEYPGILQWMIEGCLDWQKNGLIKPDVVQHETEAYFDDQDIFSQWLEECTARKYETTGEPSSRLFESWRRWARQQGEDPGTNKAFVEKMVAAGYLYTKNVPGQHGKRGFRGIALQVWSAEGGRYED